MRGASTSRLQAPISAFRRKRRSDQVMIFKIVRRKEWDEATKAGVFSGSSDDRADGFINCPAAHQLRATCDKHFAAEEGLLLIAVEPAALSEALRWNVSRGGDKFPHLYAELPLSFVQSVIEIGRDAMGRPIFPPGIP